MSPADADPPADAPPNRADTAAPPLQPGTRILVGIAGGIACYKTASLVSNLVQNHAHVRVAMTDAATRFVGPLTFQSLTGQPVITSLWQHDDHPDSQHVGLARWAQLMVIAPATASLIARLAVGLADDPICLAAAALPETTPLLLAPAMNAQMWQNPINQRNLQTLRDLRGIRTIGPDQGWQACRTAGPGRMSEPDAIYHAIATALLPRA